VRRLLLLITLVAAGCNESDPPTAPTLPPATDGCAGVRGPVRAWLLGGGSVLIPPQGNANLQALASDLRTDYLGAWNPTFLPRTAARVNGVIAEATRFLADVPTGEVLIVGHSSGGADGDAIARGLAGAANRIWLITLDPVEDTVAIGEPVDVRDSPLTGAAGRHYHILQLDPGPTIPNTSLQLGIKIDYRAGTMRRDVLTDVAHGDVDDVAMARVRRDIEDNFGACRR